MKKTKELNRIIIAIAALLTMLVCGIGGASYHLIAEVSADVDMLKHSTTWNKFNIEQLRLDVKELTPVAEPITTPLDEMLPVSMAAHLVGEDKDQLNTIEDIVNDLLLKCY